MAVEGNGLSENVFIQSPRVSFGEPPVSSAQSSLLTFADMVLSFDRKTALDLQNIKTTPDSSFSVDLDLDLEIKRDGCKLRAFDHTYASCRSFRTTRSQTAKAAQLSTECPLPGKDKAIDRNTNSDADSDLEMELDANSQCSDKKNSINLEDVEAGTKSSQLHCLPRTPPLTAMDPFSAHNYCVRSKRCSSEENISSDSLNSSRDNENYKEWPQGQLKLEKHSRKSCSTEDMDKKTRIKSCKSSESVQKGCVSQTLHRFVNNTLEFPCWPRKADHTYATATWDGTAASHSLFEGDQSSHSGVFVAKNEDCPMEESDTSILSPPQGRRITPTQPHSLFPNHINMQQKEDHTYVKHAYNTDKVFPFSSASNHAKLDASEKSSGFCNKGTSNSVVDNHAPWPPRFSSATFPRLKSREDHTYFHSGLTGGNNSTTGGREWASAQTVANVELSQDMQIEETYRSLHSFSQSASAKKDHNYSTSA
ncbi:hypothetical protein RRG08_038724 [Elysia crispata]|uniref:Uncharacterized protein n=1 Tax=Elysia crispata TaxID=231223 RepID=A0AAE0ZIR9_9GAST|nr:hypothetical protein RRG08_038724 [Elysia crispata]